VQGLEYRVAAINSAGTGAYSPATQLTCKYGGACEVGDLGPGGGVVYDVAPATVAANGTVSGGTTGSEVSGADWEFSGNHNWAAMAFAGTTQCPGRSCYSPAPPVACFAPTNPNIETCQSRYSWHLPFEQPYTNGNEWKLLCNKYDALSTTWGHLYGTDGSMYWSGSNPVIPAGITFTLSVANILSVIADPGVGVLADMTQEAYENWMSSKSATVAAMYFPCSTNSKNANDSYNTSSGRMFNKSGGTIYADNSMHTPIDQHAHLSIPIRMFNTNKPALAPQTAPVLTATSGDGGVRLSWTAGVQSAATIAATTTGRAQILPLTDYLIKYKASSDSTWTTYSHAPSVNMSAVIGNGVLKQGTSYQFSVAEVNSLGNSADSQVASAKPGRFFQNPLAITSLSGQFPNVTLTSTGGSGTGAVTYSATNGTASGCSINGASLTATTTGSCNVIATKAGDSDYVDANSPTQVVTITKGPQSTLQITSTSGPFDQPLSLSTSGGDGTGAVSYAVYSLDTDICSITGATLTYRPRSPMTGSCRITATKASDTSYLEASSAVTTINWTRGTQAPFSIAAPSSATVPVQKVTVHTDGGSGSGAITFAISNGTAKNCALGTVNQSSSSSSVDVWANNFGSKPDSAGTCIVTATKAADATYNSATTAPTTVTFNKGAQATLSLSGPSIGSWTGINLTTVGGTGDGEVTYSIATPGSTALQAATNCRISGTTVIASTTGGCWVTATKGSDDAYNATTSAKVEYSLVRAEQSALGASVNPTSGALGANTSVTLASTGGSGSGSVTYSIAGGSASGCTLVSGKINATSTGTCIITATKASDLLYFSSSATTTFTITKGTQTALTVNPTRGQALSLGTSVQLSTSGGSGTGPITYSVTDTGTAHCSITGSKIVATSAGSCGVSATKEGDINYNSTSSVVVNVPFDVQTGDAGPSGGVIVYVAATTQNWGRYLEMAPDGWSGGTADPVTNWVTALTSASNYRGGGNSDWRLPTQAEINALVTKGYFSGYWSADNSSGINKKVRPIRAFGQ
jgi:hypothetical protein